MAGIIKALSENRHNYTGPERAQLEALSNADSSSSSSASSSSSSLIPSASFNRSAFGLAIFTQDNWKHSIDQIQQVINRFKSTISQSSQSLKSLDCPITLALPTDPVVTNCGHLFSQAAVQKTPSCALCTTPITTLTPVHAVRDLIEGWDEDNPVPTFSNFISINKPRASLYLELAAKFVKEEDYTEALEVYEKAFQYIRNSGIYKVIPTLYDNLHDSDKATLSRLYLCLYQLREGKMQLAQQTVKSLETCKSLPDDLQSQIQQIQNEISSIIDSNSSFIRPSIISLREWKEPKLMQLSPPPKLTDFLSQDSSAWPGKKNSETHIFFPLFSHINLDDSLNSSVSLEDNPATVPFTFETLIKAEIDCKRLEYGFDFRISEGIQFHESFKRKNLASDQGLRWGVMTKHFIPGTEGRLYSDQVKSLPLGYQPPPTVFDVAQGLIWGQRQLDQRLLEGNRRARDGYPIPNVTACEDMLEIGDVYFKGLYIRDNSNQFLSGQGIGMLGWMEFFSQDE